MRQSSPSSSSRPRGSKSRSHSTSTTLSAALEQRPPRIGIIDLLMSGGAGLEFCRSVREAGIPCWPSRACSRAKKRSKRVPMRSCGSRSAPLQLVSAVRTCSGRAPSCGEHVRTMSERILSGEPRLDEVLGGGLPPNAINLDHGTARHRQDDLRPAVPLRERDADGSGALPVDGVRTAREGRSGTARPSSSSTRTRSVPACSTRISGQAWPNDARSTPSSIASSNSSANAHRA